MTQIAIVGGGKSWIRAPFYDPSWQVWAHASCFEGMSAHRVTRWYDVHRPAVRAGVKTWSTRYRNWLTNPDEGRAASVYVLDGFSPERAGIDTIENAAIFDHVVIPWADIHTWLVTRGATQQEYVTSTGAWMLMHALYEHRDIDLTVGIWGIDYEEEGEYLIQRPCMEHWIGFARALGVKVYVQPSSNLGRDDHVYGFDGYRPDLVHTHRPYRRARGFQPVSVRQAIGAEPMHDIPPDIQKLIEEEKARYGMDTAAEWAKAAQLR